MIKKTAPSARSRYLRPELVVACWLHPTYSNVGKTIIHHPFGKGLYHLFMMIWGMLYTCASHMSSFFCCLLIFLVHPDQVHTIEQNPAAWRTHHRWSPDMEEKRHIIRNGNSNHQQDILFGGLEHFLFVHTMFFLRLTDFHIFQRGNLKPPTS